MGTAQAKVANPPQYAFPPWQYYTVAHCFWRGEATLLLRATTLEGLATGIKEIAERVEQEGQPPPASAPLWKGPGSLKLPIEELPRWLREILAARLPEWLVWLLPSSVVALIIGRRELWDRLRGAMRAGSCTASCCPPGVDCFCVCVTYRRLTLGGRVMAELPWHVEPCGGNCVWVVPAGCP
jgi:hypothetical protein